MNIKKEVSVSKVAKDAEELFRGGFFCSEAVVSSIRSNFELDIPEEVISMASGFPVGIGRAKCLCGAVSGGVMALGIFFGRTKQRDPKVEKMTGSKLPTEKMHYVVVYLQKNLIWAQVLTKSSV